MAFAPGFATTPEVFLPQTDSAVDVFDPNWMAAMQPQWPVSFFELPSVVASGMTPSNLVNP